MTIINPGIACLTIRSAPRPAAQAVGWHNGIYLTQVGDNARTEIEAEIQEFDCFRGIMRRYSWNDIETDIGEYDGIATHILPDLVRTAVLGSGVNRKRMIIMLHLRQTSSVSASAALDVVPNWMISNPAYNGGQWTFTNSNPNTPEAGGKMVCLWDPGVQSRFALCIQAIADVVTTFTAPDALGVPYNPVEAIVLSECSIGGAPFASQPYGATFPTFYEEKYSEGYYRLCLNLKTSFPNHVTAGFTNFPKMEVNRMIMGGTFYTGGQSVDGLLVEGIGIGAPNIVKDDPGYDPLRTDGAGNPGSHAYYDDAHNVVPIMPSWQKPDYVWTRLDLPPNDNNPTGHEPTIEELYLYTRDELFANYAILTRTDEGTYWADTKSYFTSSGVKNMITGGLNSAKPNAYASINTN